MQNLTENQPTIFDSPRLSAWMRRLSFAVFRWRGWQLTGEMPALKKGVIIGAPHTSNWDFPVALGLAFCFQVKIYWMGKHTLFRWPFGGFMRWLGGIPVNRSSSQNLVGQAVAAMQAREELIFAIPPEGTRKQVQHWKTGFYFIAHEAGVPIVLAFVDLKNKRAGFGPVLTPSGNLENDMEAIKAYYAPIEKDVRGEAVSTL